MYEFTTTEYTQYYYGHLAKSKFEIQVKRLFGENNPNTILREKVEM